MKKKNIKISKAEKELLENIQSIFADYYRKALSENIKRGIAYKKLSLSKNNKLK